MRFLGALVLPLVSGGLLALGCFDLTQTGTGTGQGAEAGAPSGDGGAEGPTVVGAGCGIEQSSGAELCLAISTCTNVVVDSEAMPHCGFRIRGKVVDLVCGCGDAVCPMGTFATCTEAAQLLASQTEQGVCVQLAEGRCIESSPAPTNNDGKNPACDRQCLTDCGGGAACASVCNCD